MKKNTIIIHCTDTPHTMNVTRETLHKWHVIENGWSAIGYAYFINQKGEIIKCRDLDGDGDVENEVGAHARGFNRGSIGICLEGRDTFNQNQFDSLRYLITDIVSRHGIKQENIIGHYQVDSGKTCPNFDVPELLRSWGEA